MGILSRRVDRIHRLPRIWSNRQLERIAGSFDGDVVSVSAWRDEDKEGRRYRDYFTAARSYVLTNYQADMRGLQGVAGEIFLDLEQPLPADLRARFDVVFNHTTLEHIYRVQTAFENLCAMSRDVVILVVPFLQQYHSDYGDYWRFTPLAVKRMFEDQGLTVLNVAFNGQPSSSVYVFAVAARDPARWQTLIGQTPFTVVEPSARGSEPFAGANAFKPRGLVALLAERLGAAKPR